MHLFLQKLARFLLLSSAFLGTLALAGIRPEIRQVVFSSDNTKVMVLTGWIQDGSGFVHGGLHLLETDTSRTLFRLSSYSEVAQMSPEQLGQRMLSSHTPRLQGAGLNTRPVSLPRFAAAHQTRPSWQEGVKAGQSKTYAVPLWTRSVPIKLTVQRSGLPCSERGLLPPGEGPASFSVEVKGQSIPVPVSAAVPCAARYSLDRVDLSGNRILLTVRAYAPGFEGPNALPLFLTAALR